MVHKPAATEQHTEQWYKVGEFSRRNWEPLIPLRKSIRNRQSHHDYMSEYTMVRALVERAIASSDEPLLASWF
jgi:hypothetical protein